MNTHAVSAIIALTLVFAGFTNAQPNGPTEIDETRLAPADFPFQLSGYFLAGSNIKDKKAPGGFYESPNVPKKIPMTAFTPEGIVLRAFPGKRAEFGEAVQGMEVHLQNGTRKTLSFSASDSRINIVQEARNENGDWMPIEYLPSSWCGNSYHNVFLAQREYWVFVAPRYTGVIETKLRFTLTMDSGEKIHSNEFHGSVNLGQFTTQQGHQPVDIMDPYLD